jgi:hypothetical protein
MVHLMKYIRGTKKLPLILSAKGSGILKWWIDASFAVHPNMRGHTGGGLSMGRGFPIVNSTKQKLNTRNSTETEIVGVDDCMPSVLWTRYFMEPPPPRVPEMSRVRIYSTPRICTPGPPGLVFIVQWSSTDIIWSVGAHGFALRAPPGGLTDRSGKTKTLQ